MKQNLFLFALLVSCTTDDGIKAFNSNPEGTITSHANGDTVLPETPITFRGSVSDPNHDTTDLIAYWYANNTIVCPDVVPSENGTVTCEMTFFPGEQQITLEVKDPQTAAGSAQIQILVTEQPTEETYPPQAQITAENVG